MNENEEIDFSKRNITNKVNNVKSGSDIPEGTEIATIVYAGTTLFYNVSGLNEEQRNDMLEWIISDIQSGTRFTREVVYHSGNIYIVY